MTLQQFIDSCIGYQWNKYTIRIMEKNIYKRKPYLTCIGLDSVPKDLLSRRVSATAHVEPFVYEFWLMDD